MSKGAEILTRAGASELLKEGEERICRICHKQFASYTCPRCNLQYCSVACYKSEKHAACTESFYKDNIVAELGGQRASSGERERMLSMLRKFEADNDESAGNDEEDDTIPDLAERLENIDMADSEAILSILTPGEREEFEASLREGPDAIRSYVDIWIPWWAQDKLVQPSLVQQISPDPSEAHQDHTSLPLILPHIKKLEKVTTKKPDDSIVFNVIELIGAYAFMCRFLNGDWMEDPIESARVMWDASRILSSNQPFAFSSVAEALASLKFRTLQHETYGVLPRTTALNLKDISDILSSHRYLIAALSDMSRVFSAAYKGSQVDSSSPLIPRPMRQKAFGSEKKLYFYVCLFSEEQDMQSLLPVLKASVDMELKLVVQEINAMESEKKVAAEAQKKTPRGALVEEL
ncbi:hypothetical protein PhCBS80983_g00570 [Powellomyces hirtus]|uniref:HIT-type domain-containing protein n=1 Tax=Powellomyces hirtus TaxID=109895 RepID=A0A507EGA9_9FUNG|nr:hypothetical protein PhCBS80983_g00570 [Powellomyces hirtus]